MLTSYAGDFSSLAPAVQGGFTATVEQRASEEAVIILDGGKEDATWLEALRTVVSVAWNIEDEPEFIEVKAASPVAATAIKAWW